MSDVSKKDWKLFQEKLPGWQEAYMAKLWKEYIKLLQKKSNASDRFWELEKRIKQDKKNPGVQLRIEKSETIYNIVYLIRLKVIKIEDIAEFSDELKQEVERILGDELWAE